MGKLELVEESESVCIYSPKYDGEKYSEFEKFLLDNRVRSEPQLKCYFNAIIAGVGKILECGARENMFRPEGGRVKALPLWADFRPVDRSVGKMRLYCLWLSERVMIIGNGGVSTQAKYNNDPFLSSCVNNLREIYRTLNRVVRKTGMSWEDDLALRKVVESVVVTRI